MTVAVICYFAVGLIVSVCLLLTRGGRRKRLPDTAKQHWGVLLLFPEYAVLGLLFWPAYLAERIWNLFRKRTSDRLP